MSKKEITDWLNWLNKLDQESWFTINHLINDYKNLEKKSVNKKQYVKDLKNLQQENEFLQRQTRHLRKQMQLQTQAISVLQQHIAAITGKNITDIQTEIEKMEYSTD